MGSRRRYQLQIKDPYKNRKILDLIELQVENSETKGQPPFEDRFHHLRMEKLYTDCQFKVGERVFDAHKLVLTASSPVFEAMLYGSLAESTKEPILITDIEPNTFEHLLNYIYTGRHKFDSVSDAIDLMYAAHKYLVTSLQANCSNFIANNLNSSNAFEIYEYAVLFDDKSLQNKCLQLIKRDTSNILSKCDYSKLSIDTLVTVLGQEQLNINSELELFNAIEKFAKSHEKKSLTETKKTEQELKLQETVKSIRFLTMTPVEFASGPSASKLLLPHESLAILSILTSPNSTKLPYPADFSKCTRRRNNNPTNITALGNRVNNIAIQKTIAQSLLNSQQQPLGFNHQNTEWGGMPPHYN